MTKEKGRQWDGKSRVSNKRNFVVQGEDSSRWDFATVTLSSSVLEKLSQEEKAKFQITEFKRSSRKENLIAKERSI